MESLAYRRYITLLLLSVYVFNQADRAIFSILMEPVKRALSLSDSELGFLAGPALVLMYVAFGVPIARLADRIDRVHVMSGAIAIWSGVVMMSSLVGQFWQFALTRIGVGIGEAGFSSVAQSLISDYHDRNERTRALSTFMLGIPLGGVVSALMGGWINQAFGWRDAFLVVGAPGLVLAILVNRTIKEPRVYTTSANTKSAISQPTLQDIVITLWTDLRLRHLALAQCLVNVVVASERSWLPTFLIRAHGVATGKLGVYLALLDGIGGVAGIWLGGYLTTRRSLGDESAQIRMMAVVTCLIGPTIGFALWTTSQSATLCALIPGYVCMYFFFGPTYSMVQGLAPPNSSATLVSLFVFIQVLCGGVVGVQVLGVASDLLARNLSDEVLGLRYAMSGAALLSVWACVHFWLASRAIQSKD